MFALIAAIIFFLAAFGVQLGSINMLMLALAFWALHFAWGFYPWSYRRAP